MPQAGGSFGDQLRGDRVAAGLTQEELAEASGLSVRAISDIERGRTCRPRPSTLRQIAKVLSLPAAVSRPLAQLPADLADFTGRREDVGQLTGSLAAAGEGLAQGALVVAAVAGAGGIGKTALAVHVAHQVAPRFPDGQLYLNLRGSSSRPVAPAEALARFLRDLGTDPAAVPADEDERAARYRSLTAGRRLLIMLDDARDAAQVRPLLPGADGCAVVVTSRSSLQDLESARLLELDILTGADARALFARIAGPARAQAEPDAARQVLAACAGVPLAIRIAAARLAARPTWSVAALAARLGDGRRVLVGELGAEPGAELRELHQRMLADDPALAVPLPAPPAARGTGPVVPRQLPAPVGSFVGRESEMAALTRLLELTGEPASAAVVISAIGGTAGVGKTALAAQWAHEIADRFPDGQLYVNLRGYAPGEPKTAGDALAGFVRALGVAGQDIPAELEERSAQYRSLLAGRRILVVLDNAGSVEQVRPLLPGTPACVAVVTSRDALAGLVARDGARRLDLDLLPLADAVGLLRALIGARVDADQDAATALAVQCCRLPLALRVAAELAAARPAVPLAALADELADQQRRLDLLDAGGDPATAVRAVFSWSYRNLGPDAARAFRLTGLHPGLDLDAYAAAALTGTTLEQAGQLLDQLARAHLIQPAGPGRHGLHDLLRAYARELAAAYDTEEERRAALTCLFDHYLHTAATAMDTLFPADQRRRSRITAPVTPAPPVTGPAAARGWLAAELASLVAIVAHTADHGWPGHATRLAATVFRYLDICGHYPEAVTIHSHACRAASQTSDRPAEAEALTNLGVVEARQGRFQRAVGHLQQALALYRETGDRIGEARVLHNLGTANLQQGRYQQAAGNYQQAVALYHETGDRIGEARALGNLGDLDLRQGCYQRAADHLQQALAMSRASGDRPGEAYALNNLGDLDLHLGCHEQAAGHLQQALALFRETGNRTGEAYALASLGEIDLRQGCYQRAVGHRQQALALFRRTGNRAGEADALSGLGEVSLAAGQPGQARTQHAAALGLASQIGDKYQQARAHDGLARSYYEAGDPGQARHHWHHALALYTDLGVPEANQVRAHLATADSHGHRGP